MSGSWNTKWGPRRVRHDPPTLAEALGAARGFTDDIDEQAAIAAGLMGVDVAEAKAELSRIAPGRRLTTVVSAKQTFPAKDKGVGRAVVVERKISRRFQAPSKPSLMR